MRGTTPPVILSSNLKPEPRGSGLMSSTTSPNWPWPPDCFLCRPRTVTGFRIVSLVADRRRPRVDGDAETVGQPLGGDAQMHLALAPHHHLVGLGVVHDDDRGILVDQLVKAWPSLTSSLRSLAVTEIASTGGWGSTVDQRRMRLLAGRQRVAGLGVFELAERDGLAGDGRPALLEVLAQDLEHAGHAAGLALPAIEA